MAECMTSGAKTPATTAFVSAPMKAYVADASSGVQWRTLSSTSYVAVGVHTCTVNVPIRASLTASPSTTTTVSTSASGSNSLSASASASCRRRLQSVGESAAMSTPATARQASVRVRERFNSFLDVPYPLHEWSMFGQLS